MGDCALQNYLVALDDEFSVFDDTVGLPDQRLLRVSMRNDILRIPYLRTTGELYTQSDRFALFRERLTSGGFNDRPLLNSRCELVINRAGEPDNEDLGLSGVTDVLLYFYYTDFTDYDRPVGDLPPAYSDEQSRSPFGGLRPGGLRPAPAGAI